jgi:hypothetical protein
MRTPTIEEFEAIAHSAAPGVFVPIGDEGMVTTREDAKWIAWTMRQREADARSLVTLQGVCYSGRGER